MNNPNKNKDIKNIEINYLVKRRICRFLIIFFSSVMTMFILYSVAGFIFNTKHDDNFNEFENIKNVEIKSSNGIIESFGYNENLKYNNLRFNQNVKIDENSDYSFITNIFNLQKASDLSKAENLRCPEDWGLIEFSLNYEKENKAFYKFKCVKLELEKSLLEKVFCKTKQSTSVSGPDRMKTIQEIGVDVNEGVSNEYKDVLRGFQLKGKMNNMSKSGEPFYEFYYDIIYCRYKYSKLNNSFIIGKKPDKNKKNDVNKTPVEDSSPKENTSSEEDKIPLENKTPEENKVPKEDNYSQENKTPQEKITSSVDLETTPTEYSKGDIFDLTKLPVNCNENKILNGFRLIKEGNNLKYTYSCIDYLTENSKIINKKTNWNSINGKKEHSTNFLDRHKVICDNNSALKKFVLIKNSSRKIAYDYDCIVIDNLNNCKEKYTNETEGADLPNNEAFTEFLERQIIKLNSKEVLVGFKLESRYEKTNSGYFPYYKYWIRYCQLP